MGGSATARVAVLAIMVVMACACGGAFASAPRPEIALDRARLSVALTGRVPARVRQVCRETQRQLWPTRARTKLRAVCPTVVPAVPIVARVSSPSAETHHYLMLFNNGDNGPALEWRVGYGTPRSLTDQVLFGIGHEVRNIPVLDQRGRLDGFDVDVYRYPFHPDRGTYGGHWAAITRTGRFSVFASMRGRHRDTAIALSVAYAQSVKAHGGYIPHGTRK